VPGSGRRQARGRALIEEADCIPAGSRMEADLCIIGGGAAGLTIARSLCGKGRRIVVLESGGLKFERAAQRLSRGITAGDPYEPLDLCRVRQYGGSTGRGGWGGWCKPLGADDFKSLTGMPLAGWPFDHATLAPYVMRAAQYLGLPALDADSDNPRLFEASAALFSEPCLLAPRSDFSRPWEASFGGDACLSLLLHATALTLQTNEARDRVVSVQAAGRSGTRFTISAHQFVLAGGGIENARILLLSEGLGNRSDCVGRYFMEHPRLSWGALQVNNNGQQITPFDPTSGGLAFGPPDERSRGRYFGIALRPEKRAELGILGSRTWIRPQVAGADNEGGEALRYLSFWMRRGRLHPSLLRQAQKMARHPIDTCQAAMMRLRRRRGMASRYCFETILEQEPQSSNRVTLDRERDAFGLQRARLEWKVGPLVHRTLRCVQETITEEMRLLGFDCSAPVEEEAPRFTWVRHHMGTTRMSEDPHTGVVDPNCRVHGTSNIFVAGSSVFPTGGNDMPTLTILALAIKLAVHLEAGLADPRERAPPPAAI
jgi:choline dehydrogenase-like flavoprotein